MKLFSYYIIESEAKPKAFEIDSESLLSVSPCIASHHPNLDMIYFDNDYDGQERYRRDLELTHKQFDDLKNDIEKLLQDGKLKSEGMFLYLDDAVEIYKKYFANTTKLTLVAVGLDEAFVEILYDEVEDIKTVIDLDNDKFKIIGHEIIGFDIGGFHSYLCNSLNNEIEKQYTIKFNKLGLIENSYEDVIEFAKLIKDKGEPVEWLPVSLYKILI